MLHRPLHRFALLLLVAASTGANASMQGPRTPAQPRDVGPAAIASAEAKPDLSGRKRRGIASFYAQRFAGRLMADGTRMDPQGDNAASKTLPLGTTARVTNLATGKSAVVTIKDRGPYVQGRIVDLSPETARQVGITRDQGLAKVEVEPIAVPLPNGDVKQGEALASARDPEQDRRRDAQPRTRAAPNAAD